jgi:signal transduction histidine kinase
MPILRLLERRVLALSASVCLLALTSTLIWLLLTLPQRVDGRLQANLVDASWNLREATWQLAQTGRDLHTIGAALADPRTGVDRTLRNINTVTAQIGRASNVARLASSEQRDALRAISQETLTTLRSAGALIAGADQNLNRGVLPSLTASLGQVQTSLLSLTADSHQMLAASTTAIDRAAALLGDPSWSRTAANLGNASQHLDGAAANTEQALGYIRDMFKPAKAGFWKALGGAVITHVAGPLAGALVEHLWNPRVEVVNTVKTQSQQ